MQEDYILISVDSEKKFAIRFQCLAHMVEESLSLHKLSGQIAQLHTGLLLGATLVGSRLDQQENILFKFRPEKTDLSLNFEVSPLGAVRSALFPFQNRDSFAGDLAGDLSVERLRKGSEIYKSMISTQGSTVEELWQDYLERSAQSQSLILISSDIENTKKNYALWIEKLPDTSKEDWEKFLKIYQDGSRFREAIAKSDDPDVIIQNLFDEPIQILAVTKPKRVCSCSEERILDALSSLPNEDLVEIFMDGQGVETQCDYCHKTWSIDDGKIQKLIKTTGSIQ